MTIDDKKDSEPAWFSLSNFFAREDLSNGDILVHCSPVGRGAAGDAKFDWTGDALLYRIHVTPPPIVTPRLEIP